MTLHLISLPLQEAITHWLHAALIKLGPSIEITEKQSHGNLCYSCMFLSIAVISVTDPLAKMNLYFVTRVIHLVRTQNFPKN